MRNTLFYECLTVFEIIREIVYLFCVYSETRELMRIL
jgi:hypothetical protein